MGSSDTGTSAGGVDCTVGSIVWVRRRNGSWWPGKILGPEELSASHLMSPRSGTPVKLLGREDASVDWYNLEKSKRVKPFRCGEFDGCIDRAEAAVGVPPKKREKYARREDAIIHALELEKQFLEKQYGKLGCSSNGKSSKSSDGIKKELETSAESLRHGYGKHVQSKPRQLSEELDLLVGGKNKNHRLQTEEVKEGSQLSGDDDNSDVLPRMRGLQDFGLRTASSKRKTLPAVASNGSQGSPFENISDAPLINGGFDTQNMNHINAKTSSEKRKRSQEGLAEESNVKRRDKRRPLVQVLESSVKLPAHHSFHPEDSSLSLYATEEGQTGVAGSAKRSKHSHHTKSSESTEDNETHSENMGISPSTYEDTSNPHAVAISKEDTSGSTEDTETDSPQTDSFETDTDDEMTEISDESIVFRPKSVVKSEPREEDGSMSSEEPSELGPTSDMSHPSPNDNISASVEVSKWQLKGKRNSRALTKRFGEGTGKNVSRGFNHEMNLSGKGSFSDEADVVEKNYGSQMVAYGSRGSNGNKRSITSWADLAWNDQPVQKGYWGNSVEYVDPVFVDRRSGDRLKCMLVEVDLKVQSSYQREHVPMISLRSKLSGQAIVGHPIPVEVLENGSADALLASVDELGQDYDTSLQPVWRTARRTANCRVPRPRSSAADDDEDYEYLQHGHQERKGASRKSNAASFNLKVSTAGKSSTQVPRPSTDRKLLRKPGKKMSLSSSQKTRTLSSISTQQKHGNYLKPGTNSYRVNGLIKPEIVPTAVACIPVKLVFSRLYEELVGRHQ